MCFQNSWISWVAVVGRGTRGRKQLLLLRSFLANCLNRCSTVTTKKKKKKKNGGRGREGEGGGRRRRNKLSMNIIKC